ncbi:hypothetical protein ABFG93_06930 [Pseudalkalibacillus hwajinpoensis]|uniref:hypothetical protein n=1 Tax=Guptibacillus hwajinpoensis TaxID=208199 RepID=UPI00325ACE49
MRRSFRLYELSLRELVQEKIAKMQAISKRGVRCQKVYANGEVPEEDFCYAIFSFIEGIDGEEVLSHLTADEQYHAGYEAGIDL